MLTRSDKSLLRILGVLLCLLMAAMMHFILNRKQETVWYSEGLFILAYASTPFIDDDLPGYLSEFADQRGTRLNVIRVTDWDSALLRSVADDVPIDVVMVPFDLREDLRRSGQVIELHAVLDEVASPSFEVAMRWLWSSIGEKPICGFLIGEFGDPTYACIWYQSQRVEEAADLIKYLVLNTSVSESRLIQPNHFARKYLVEKDYDVIYTQSSTSLPARSGG